MIGRVADGWGKNRTERLSINRILAGTQTGITLLGQLELFSQPIYRGTLVRSEILRAGKKPGVDANGSGQPYWRGAMLIGVENGERAGLPQTRNRVSARHSNQRKNRKSAAGGFVSG